MKPFAAGVLLLFATFVAADDESESKVAPLFTDHEIVPVTITAPFKQLMTDRNDEELQGTFVYTDVEADEEVSLDIGLRTRGRFRRDKDVCNFAPLRLNFRKTKGTLFAKSDKMKLVTHCRNRSNRYQQAVLKEYIAYRILNTVTDWSFRVRLLKVRYFDSSTGEEINESWAFLIEEDGQLAKRIGMEVDPSERTRISALDPAHTNLMSVFQFLVGNTDFSPIRGAPDEPCCHNYVLMGNDEVEISVPYDFDVTGIVAPPHAVPNSRFKINSVKERLYRGRCANNGQLESTFQAFRDKRTEIVDIIESLEPLSNSERKKTLRFVEGFYKIINSERQVKNRILEACLGK